MVNFKFIARILVLVIFSNTAFAGYQSMRPPPGYSRNPTTGGTMQPGWGPVYKAPPGEFYDMTKKQWMTSAQLNTGGRDLAVPVAMPLATGVSVGLAVASAFSSNPAILLATAAFALYQAYLSEKKITAKPDGTFDQVVDGLSCQSNCSEYLANHPGAQWQKSLTSLVSAYISWYTVAAGTSPTYKLSDPRSDGSYLATHVYNGSSFREWVQHQTRSVPSYDQSTTKVISPSAVASEMQTIPMPEPLVKSWPYPVPVDAPVFNPGPDNNPRVLRIPQGSPVAQPLPSPNPDNLPQTWKTPVVDVIPSPTVDDPWRVETVPRDITKVSPTPIVDPLNPNAPLAPPVTQPETDPTTKTTEKAPTLCEQYPDILACSKPKLDTPDTPTLETRPKDITYAPQSGWGGGGGACPAPRHLNGANVDFEFTMFCNFMSGIKPIVLAFASLAAGMIIIGARGGAAE